MSVVLRQGAVKVTQPDGTVKSLDVVVDQTRDQAITDISAAKDESVQAIEAKRDAVLAEIPDDYPGLVEDVTEIKGDLTALETSVGTKLTEPATAQIGQFFRVASIDADGHYVLEAVDAPSGGVTDVQLNGATVVKDRVATIPIATANQVMGLIRTNAAYGVSAFGNGYIGISSTSQDHINRRLSNSPVTTNAIDSAVKAAMCDGVGAAWTVEEQAAAQQRLGILSVEEVLFG